MEITTFVVSGRDKAKLYGDYGTYRTQLSNRIHNLRRKLGVATKPRAKYTKKAPVTPEDIARNNEFVNLLLLTSERAWAHAMSMRDTHAAEKSGITGPSRSHIISRLHKAILSASHLFTLLSDRSTTSATLEDVLEARAYAAALTGAMHFEKQAWEACVKAYSEARIVYSALAASTKQEVFRDVLEETVDPSIRYAAYQLRMPRTVAIPTIARKFFSSEDKELVGQVEKLDPDVLNEQPAKARAEVADAGSEAAPKTITWRSRTVDIEDAAIASALAAVKTAEKKLAETLKSLSNEQARERAAAYDDILIASQDAVDATKHALDELVGEGAGQGDKRIQSLQITRTALSYEMVSWRIGRNRVLAGEADGALVSAPVVKKLRKGQVQKEEGTGRKLAHLREKVVLYDGVIQSLDSVKELPGVAADEKFLEELEVKYGYFTALKCLTLARSHALLSNPKNSLALLALASQKLTLSSKTSSAMDTTSPETPPNIIINTTQLSSLSSLLFNEVNHFRGLVELQTLAESSGKKKNEGGEWRPLVERLNDYGTVDTKNLVVYPPQVEVAPVKPLFFDAAWNYIEYPSVDGQEKKKAVEVKTESKEEEKTASQQTQAQVQAQKKGWFGFGR